MKKMILSFALVAGLVALAAAPRTARAQDAQAPAPAAPVDSNALFAGDWDWSASLRDSSLAGSYRLNYVNGRFTGIVTRPGEPPTPVQSFTVRGGRNFTMTVAWNGQIYTFQGRLDNARSGSGTLSFTGSQGRLRIQKRGS